MPPTLLEIHKAKTGKVSDKWESYLVHYERLFSARREQPIRFLELGVQNGGSLETWADYFPNGQIYGVDINPRCADLQFNERITVVVGDAKQPLLDGQFDIIIDDASHLSADIIAQFETWFPKLVDGGIYIVEDLHTMWLPQFGNDALRYFGNFISAVNRDVSGGGPHVAAVEFRNSLVIVHKGAAPRGARLICGTEELVVPVSRLVPPEYRNLDAELSQGT